MPSSSCGSRLEALLAQEREQLVAVRDPSLTGRRSSRVPSLRLRIQYLAVPRREANVLPDLGSRVWPRGPDPQSVFSGSWRSRRAASTASSSTGRASRPPRASTARPPRARDRRAARRAPRWPARPTSTAPSRQPAPPLDGPWGRTPPNERSRLLHALADAIQANRKELAELESRNVGKAISSVKAEVGRRGRELPLLRLGRSARSPAARIRSAARCSRTR